MKIRIAFKEDERQTADKLTEELKNNKNLSIVKVKKSDAKDGFFHTYLATKKHRKAHK